MPMQVYKKWDVKCRHLRNIIGILEINDDYITNWFLCNTLLKFIYC